MPVWHPHLGCPVCVRSEAMPKASASSASLLASFGSVERNLPTPCEKTEKLSGWARAVRVCECSGLSRRKARKVLNILCVKLHLWDFTFPLQVDCRVFQLKWMKQILPSFIHLWLCDQWLSSRDLTRVTWRVECGFLCCLCEKGDFKALEGHSCPLAH